MKHRADKANTKGWVRNLPDGSVEAGFEGEKKDVQSSISFCRRGPPAAVVTNVEAEWANYLGEFKGFKIQYE